MTSHSALYSETIDLAEFVRTIGRGWRWVLVGLALGLAVAVAVILFVPPRFKSTASVVIRPSEKSASVMAAAKLTGAGSSGGSIQDAASSLLPDALNNSPIETDVQILESRSLAAEAVDSLGLQVRVRSRDRRPPLELFDLIQLPGAFKKKDLNFARNASGSYEVTGWNDPVHVAPGQLLRLPGGSLVIDKNAPSSFDVTLYDREEATTRFIERLNVSKKGGEVVGVSFEANDSITAAAAPNLLVRRYLDLRRTTDRSVNERRVEFLTAQVDSFEKALTGVERALRTEQESSGVIDPAVVGKLDLQRAGVLRTTAGELDLERGALTQLLSQLAAGQLSARQLAAYPTFLKSSAVNDLLSQLSVLETKRLELLATLTPEDPTVIAATEGIKNIENQLAPLARTYEIALDRQRADLSKQIDTLQSSIASLPATSELAQRRQRDVLRLAAIGTAVRGQLVDAKLAAIADGGDVRLLDTAFPPRKISFPTKTLTLSGGLIGGLLAGLAFAFLAGSFGRYVRGPYAIERQLGVPALAFDDDSPLMLAGSHPLRTLLLVPLDPYADTAGVAQRVVRSAANRGLTGTILDLSKGGIAGNGKGAIASLLNEFDIVAVRLPKLASDATLGALGEDRPVVFVASAGRVDRRELANNVDTLRRFGVSCAGVVVSRQRQPPVPQIG